ncbi:MAG: redoxin domain-containing protein [Flavobacteriales bacterium]|nr:redoxin domain-containing protein [Flavobacteriales bacterium]
MKKRITNTVLLVILVAVAAFYFKRYRIAPNIAEKRVVFQTPHGLDSLDSFLDKNLVLIFYAGWCGTCHREMPGLVQAYAKLKEANFEVIGLTDDREEVIDKFRSNYGIAFPMYKLSGTLQDVGVYTLPTTFVMNSKGEVVFEHVEYMDWTDPAVVQEVIQSARN